MPTKNTLLCSGVNYSRYLLNMQAIWFAINISDDFLEDYEKDVNIEVEKGTKRKNLKYFGVSFNKKITDLYEISYIFKNS